MKLYYYPGASSMAVHIAMRETGLSFEIDKVDLREKKTESGEDFNQVNPKGYVPALRLDDGQVLTEDAVLLQYVADLRPESGLAPVFGSMERYRLMEWLNFISSELHKPLGGLFNPNITPEWKDGLIAMFSRRADWIAGVLARQPYLMGERFTVADIYLFNVVGWCSLLGVVTGRWPALNDYAGRIALRPAVIAAMTAEGLIA
jgi:glutathione S-transferase